jgi:hypothetical protein
LLILVAQPEGVDTGLEEADTGLAVGLAVPGVSAMGVKDAAVPGCLIAPLPHAVTVMTTVKAVRETRIALTGRLPPRLLSLVTLS